jgi:formylglycine-generating enzyme
MMRRLGLISRCAVLWAGLALAPALVSQACEVDPDACQRSRTCAPTGGQGGLGGMGGTSGEGPGPTAGAAGSGAEGGLGGAASASTSAIRELGDGCALEGQYACAGHAQRVQLICERGAFVESGICGPTERCDTAAGATGLCQPVVAECVGHGPGDVVCRGSERIACGADLVTSESLETCSGGCVNGDCTECVPGAEPFCELNTVHACSELGTWELTSCAAETPVCTEGECGVPPSCLGLPNTCGVTSPGVLGEPCCTSPLVTGGQFQRNNNPSLSATISTFRLDRFEVTVGRFRRFKAAWDEGWRPDNGSGKHMHLNGGQGLIDLAFPEGFELGWRNEYLAHTAPNDTNLSMDSGEPDPYATWTSTAGQNETRPINRLTRHEAYVFCIWDGGFLPSDAEWSYAAVGGGEQRTYPWGSNPPDNTKHWAVYGCLFGGDSGTCRDYHNIAPVGQTDGIGLFGQLDLLGNVAEWTLGATSAPECDDCAEVSLDVEGEPVGAPCRGRAFDDDAAALLSTSCFDDSHPNDYRARTVGVRCARSP